LPLPSTGWDGSIEFVPAGLTRFAGDQLLPPSVDVVTTVSSSCPAEDGLSSVELATT
jgi:hypothetical protein